MAENGEVTFELPSLLTLSYNSCSDVQKKWYDELPVPSVDLQPCCKEIIEILRLNSHENCFNPHDNLRSMFPKMRLHLQQSATERFENQYSTKDIVSEIAASHGHLDCMKLARAIGVPWFSTRSTQWSACDRAAENGHLDCLIYAHMNGDQWSVQTSKVATSNGHLDCLRYLHDNGCPWDSLIMCNLAVIGGLEVLKYCRENGCQWDDMTCIIAVYAENLECLKYARDNGCPWGRYVCLTAAGLGNLECLKFAYENGCDWEIDEYLNFYDSPESYDPSCYRYALEMRSKRTEEERN